MASIPYAAPVVDPAALPGARQESIATPGFLAGAADSEIKFGENMTHAGTGIDAIAVHMQNRDNLRGVQDATTALAKWSTDYQTNMQQNQTGEAAATALADFREAHKKKVDEISGTLANPAQQQAFGALAAKSGQAGDSTAATWQVHQTTKANADAADATQKTLVNQGAIALTDSAAQTFKGQIELNAKAYASTLKLNKVETDLMVTNAVTEFHKQRIQQLATTNPDIAAAYFKEYKEEIAGSQRAEIGKFADQATAVTVGVKGARDIFTQVGAKGGLDAMLKIAEDKFANQPEVFKAVNAQLHTLVTAAKEGEVARMDGVAATVLRASTAGKTKAQVMAMPEFITLNTQMGDAGAKQAASILDHIQSKAQAAVSFAQAQESYAYTRELRQQQVLSKQHDADFWKYAEPDVISKMSNDQIEVLRPKIGDAHTNRLHEMQNAYAKSEDAAGAAKMDMTTFKALAEGAGMRPNEPKQTEEQKARLSRVYLAVTDQITAATKAKGRPLNPTEKKDEAKKAFDDEVRKPNFWKSDESMPVSAMTPTERQSAYVVVPTTDRRGGPSVKVKIGDIPDDFVKEAEARERARGGEPTQASIAWQWNRNGPAWAAKRKADF